MTDLLESGLGRLTCTSGGHHAPIWCHHLDMEEARIGESPSLISGKEDSSHHALERSDRKMWTAEDHGVKSESDRGQDTSTTSQSQFKSLK